MDTQVHGGEREHEDKHCAYVYPEGHEKAGQQCRGMKGATGLCAGHARSQGLLKPREAAAEAAAPSPEELQEQQAALAAAQEMAQLSLSRRAAAWLADPKTQAKLTGRWDQILENGSDAELIRLVKELTDRVEGRAGEAQPEETVSIPPGLQAIRDMSSAERRALIMRAHQQ